MRHPLCLLPWLTALLLGGCNNLEEVATVQTPSNSPSPRVIVSPIAIGYVQAPATAKVNKPLTITVWAHPGTCFGLGTPTLEVDESTRHVTVRETSRYVEGTLCGQIDIGYISASVTFTPSNVGTYELKAEPFVAVSDGEWATEIRQSASPSATLSIEVVAP